MCKLFRLIVGGGLYYGIAFYLPNGNFPIIGKICKKIRAHLCHFINPLISTKSVIERRVYLGNIIDIKIGNNSGFGNRFKVQNTILEIGENVMTAEDVLVIGGGHKFERTDIPIGEQGNIGKTHLKIGDDVWIGARSVILAKNISIGHGVIIGAGAVITKSIPDYAIVAGNPAKIIRYRNQRINGKCSVERCSADSGIGCKSID